MTNNETYDEIVGQILAILNKIKATISDETDIA
jgi:hypothetical protein